MRPLGQKIDGKIDLFKLLTLEQGGLRYPGQNILTQPFNTGQLCKKLLTLLIKIFKLT